MQDKNLTLFFFKLKSESTKLGNKILKNYRLIQEGELDGSVCLEDFRF